MKPQPAFFDASALVPLCVREATSRQAQAHLRQSLPVVWWGTPVEIHSAVARLHRMAVLSDRERKGALARLELLSRGWREILPADSRAGIGKAIVGYSSASSGRQLATGGGSHLVSPTTQEPQFCFRRSAAIPSRGLSGIYCPCAFPLTRGEGPTPKPAGRYPSARRRTGLATDGFLCGSSPIRAALRCLSSRTRSEKPHRNAKYAYLCATRRRS